MTIRKAGLVMNDEWLTSDDGFIIVQATIEHDGFEKVYCVVPQARPRCQTPTVQHRLERSQIIMARSPGQV